MKQTVRSAEINECTEISDILNSSLDNIAHVNSGEELLLGFLLLGYNKLLAVADDSSSSRIELDDHEFNLLIHVFVEILLKGVRYEAGRDEYTRAVYVDTQSAVQNADNLCLQNLMVLKCLFEFLIASLGNQLLVGEKYLTLAIVDLHDLDFHLVTDFNDGCQIQRVIIRILVSGQNAISLNPDVQDDLLRFDVDDRSLDYLSVMYGLERLVQHFFKA